MASFVNPSSLIAQVGLVPGATVADLGCGGGFYAIPAAKMVGNSGTVYGVDIQESKLAITQSTARQMGLHNVVIVKADLDKPLAQMQPNSCDVVITASILHEIDSKDALLKN